MLKENRIYVRVKKCPFNPSLIGREGFYYKHLVSQIDDKLLTNWYSKEGIYPYRVTMSLDCFEEIKSYT